MDEIDFEKLCQDMNLTKKLDHTVIIEIYNNIVGVPSNCFCKTSNNLK